MAAMPIDSYFAEMVARKASDLYLTFASAPCLRIGDSILPLSDTPLDDTALNDLLEQITDANQRDEFASTMELNTSFNWREMSRFRVNICKQQGHIGIVIRRIQMEIPTLEELNLPPLYGDLAMLRRGLILIVGQTGSGKTSSITAMVGHRNMNGSGHIITVEDPIEYVHTHKNCIITQRDVGLDTYSYAIALKNALRQRPDMVVVGEVRDREVMEQAIYFAETGHLCIATLHANNSSQAIERVLNFFPEEQQRQVLFNLAVNLRGILSQRLVRNTRGSRSLACEILLNNGLIRNLIEENKIRQIRDMIEKGTTDGMQTFDQHLFRLIQEGEILEEVALGDADNPSNLRLQLNKRGMAKTISHNIMLKRSAVDSAAKRSETSDF